MIEDVSDFIFVPDAMKWFSNKSKDMNKNNCTQKMIYMKMYFIRHLIKK